MKGNWSKYRVWGGSNPVAIFEIFLARDESRRSRTRIGEFDSYLAGNLGRYSQTPTPGQTWELTLLSPGNDKNNKNKKKNPTQLLPEWVVLAL